MWSLIETDRKTWDAYWGQIERTNLLQSWEYGEAKSKAERRIPRRFVIKDKLGQPRGLVQVLTKAFHFIGGVARINRGPLLIDTRPELDTYMSDVSQALAAILRLARSNRWWYLSIAPEAPQSSTANELLEKLGFKLAPGSAWGSAMLSLEPSEEELLKNLKGKWRNLLRKAQRFGSDVQVSSTPEDIDILVKYYNELQQSAGFKGVPGKIIRCLAIQSGPHFDFTVLWFRKHNNSSPIGFLVSVGHGDTCTYFIGWTSPEGRRLQANYLLLWHAILMAKEKGYRWFDMGGLDKNTPKGIAHFKEGVGGVPYSLVGEWKWHMLRKMKSD